MRSELRGSRRGRPPLPRGTIQESIEALFGNDARVAAVALFGSYVRQRVRGGSDVDLAVLLTLAAEKQEAALEWRYAWQQEFSREWGGYPVEVIVLPQAPLLLRRNISREGQILLERQPGAWKQFRQRVLKEWRDRARVRERFWRRFLQRWEEVGFGERYGNPSEALDQMRRIRLSPAEDADRQ